MFDTLPSVPRDPALDAVQSLFGELGHRLAEAAGLIGGPSAEAQVVALALDLVHASRMTDRMREGLTTLHRLLMLEEVQGTYPAEAVLSGIDLGSSRIAEICLLTDLLGDFLDTVPATPLTCLRRPVPARSAFRRRAPPETSRSSDIGGPALTPRHRSAGKAWRTT